MKRVVALLIGSAIAAAACGGNSDTPAVNSPEEPEDVPIMGATTTTLATPPTTAAATLTPAGRWVIHAATDGGYTAEAVLEIGAPVRHEQIAEQMPRACAVDPMTDAVAAGQVTITNTTPDFAVSISFELELESYIAVQPGEGLDVSGDVDYEAGAQCVHDDQLGRPQPEVYGIAWADPFSPGESRTGSTFFFVLRNYFTPASPTGDVAAYERTNLTFGFFVDGESTGSVVDGPTITSYAIPISGHLPPCPEPRSPDC